MRWFYSKGAFLIIFWSVMTNTAASSVNKMYNDLNKRGYTHWIGSLTAGLLSVPVLIFLGWLADRKFGNYRVAKFGLVLLFPGTLGFSIYSLFPDFMAEYRTVAVIVFSIVVSMNVLGFVCTAPTLLQLGLDQMPEASSSSITSFIAWFVFSYFFGNWISDMLYHPVHYCLFYHLSKINLIQIWSLQPPLCIGIIIISDIWFAKNWLIIEPKSPQSIKTVYRVLKFAAKHKAPLNRSALTYWEEDIPSRLDLGKLKYGGPFTTEQVEDVKTILRLLAITLSMLMISIALYLSPGSATLEIPYTFPSLSDSTSVLLYKVTYSYNWCPVIGTVIHEFIVYPIMRNKIPSILRRIGILSFISAIMSSVFLVLELIHHYNNNEYTVKWVESVLLNISHGLLAMLLYTAIVELVCAQAPYKMRGLFANYASILILFAIFIADSVSKHDYNVYIKLVLFAVKLAMSLFGFILYCLLAHWYKLRVRDEVFSPHRVVEEVYDRYLTAEREQFN